MPRVNQLLNWVMGINFLCGIVFLLTIVYEYGFSLPASSYEVVHTVYHTIWILFLCTTTLQIVFRQEDSAFKFTPWTWILTILLYLTLLPVVFKQPEENTGVYWVWVFFHHNYYKGAISRPAFFFAIVGHRSPSVGQTHQSVVDSGRKFPDFHSGGNRPADASPCHLPWHFFHGCAVHCHECDVCHGACHRGCAFHLHAGRADTHHLADSDWRTGSHDADQFFCHVLHGKHLAL